MPRLIAFVILLYATTAQEIKLGVVEPQPMRAQQLAAAAEAVLGAGAVSVAPVEPDEPLALAAHLCAQGGEGVAAVVAGGGPQALRLAEAAAARAGVPLLLVDPSPADSSWEALALQPHPEVLAEACRELCRAKGWRRAVLLHEGVGEGAALVAPEAEPLALLARQLPPSNDDALLSRTWQTDFLFMYVKVIKDINLISTVHHGPLQLQISDETSLHIRFLSLSLPISNRSLLLILKKLDATNFIVWCDAKCSVRVLDAAQRVGLLSERHSYIMLSLDLHTQPLANYSHGGANVTALRLFDPESTEVMEMMTLWRDSYQHRLGDAVDSEEMTALSSAPPSALPLAQQAAKLTSEVLVQLRLPPAAPANCETGAAAFHADTLLNYLRSDDWPGGRGTGGRVSWERDGARREVQLQVAELARGGRLRAAGLWAPRGPLAWRRTDAPADTAPHDSMTNRTFTVLIAQSKPYVMRQESLSRLAGNDRYEGFCIELIDKLSKMLQFNYTFVEQPDGVYGNCDNVTNKCNGMLGRLMNDETIDFAVTDLTITSEREKAVDFTTPFMNLGIAILFRKPEPPEPKLFAFLLPFSNGVWICLGFAYLGTSLLLYVVGRLCHEEWQNPYPCIEDPPALENQFTLANALWFNLGAVLLQGSEIAPVAYSTRAVASVWWLFALVITSSYTANLATLLATKSTTELIHNVRELADNTLGITYGAKEGGSTYNFFKNSESELFQRMYRHMSEHEMPTSNNEGIDKVTNENYAFLMESTSIDYVVERNCKVTKVGDLLDSKGYGIAMKKDSPFRQALNLALLNLQEAGILREMTYTWWKKRNGGGACKDDDERENEELRMGNFLGLFLVLVVGCALGVLVSCCDLAAAAYRRRDRARSFAQRFWAELRFVFRFDQSVKPLQGPLIGSSSSSPASEPASAPIEQRSITEEEKTVAARARSASGAAGGAIGSAVGGGAGGAMGGGAGGAMGGGAGGAARRRSSMHAASMRLARHAAAAAGRDSTTPARP